MKKRILSMFLAAAMVFSMTACSGDNKDNSSGKSDGDSITISVHPSGHGLPAYVAEQNGYYEEEGLNVETLVYWSAASDGSISDGSLGYWNDRFWRNRLRSSAEGFENNRPKHR